MDFSELIKTRYSVRSFSDRKIEGDKLEKIIEAAKVAPTAKNMQPQKIYVLQSEEALKKINSVCRCIFGAPTVLLITSDTEEEWKNPFTNDYHTGDIDCSIACTHMMLQAWELGIGSCWVGFFDPELVKKTFALPAKQKLVAILPLGYPSADSKPIAMHSTFRPMSEMVKCL